MGRPKRAPHPPIVQIIMPLFLERRLAAGARKKKLTGEKAKAYIYGALNNLGMMKGNKVTPKGEAAQEKHEEDQRRLKSHRRSYRKKK